MAENSRKKKLPIAVLAAPALAFGSLTLAATPALAVPQNEVQQILAEEGIDTILVYATEDVAIEREDGADGTHPQGSPLQVDDYEDGYFIGYDGARFDMSPFEHATAEQYEAADLPVPTFIRSLEDTSREPLPGDSDEEGETNDGRETSIEVADARPGENANVTGSGFSSGSEVALSLNAGEAVIGTVDVNGEFAASVPVPANMEPGTYDLVVTVDDEELTVSLTVLAAEDDTDEVDEGEDQEAYELLPLLSADVTQAEVGATVRLTVDNADELVAEYGTDTELFIQGALFSADEDYGYFGSDGITAVENAHGVFEFVIPASLQTDTGLLSVEPGAQFEFYSDIRLANGDFVWSDTSVTIDIIQDAAPAESTPELTVSTTEISLEDFVGDPHEGAGVLHDLTGFEPGTEIEYSVDTPEGIEPFSESGVIGDEGEAAFTIYGEDLGDTSVYLGDYTTTVTFVVDNGESQELTASFSVVTGDDDSVTPVVETESTSDAPAVGASADNLAKTGASGTQLALLAGGLLVLGGAALAFANRRRFAGRNN